MKSAAEVIEVCLPSPNSRLAVLSQLIHSAKVAGSVAPSAWSLTLFSNGFRLNVGQVEALTVFDGLVRILLSAASDDLRLQGIRVQPTSYKSVKGPQCAFEGTPDEFLAEREALESMHFEFIKMAACTSTGRPRRGSPFTRYHSDALLNYAIKATASAVPQHEIERPAYEFEVGANYTREAIFKVIGMPPPKGGPWFTGYADYGPDWFIFCGIGTQGRTGHEYGNYFEGDRLVWFGKGPSKLQHATIQDLLSAAGRVYIFYRENDRDPFIFAGLGRATEVLDSSPVKVKWAFDEPSGSPLATILPEEVDSLTQSTVFEGARKTIEINVYERDVNARRKCILHWGATCVICRFSFEEEYGPLGRGFIHVHHLRPLSEVGVGYQLDPIADLRPVCPNCHAMLHRARPVLTIDELKLRLAKKKP